MPANTMLNPVPAIMVSCSHKDFNEGRPNIITIAWAGTICSDPPMLSISIRKSRLSHEIVSASGEFVVNLVSRNLLKACDFCGVRSGRDYDKFQECHLTSIPADSLSSAPAIAESPVSISCKVAGVYELGAHDLFMARIESVTVNAELMDEKGRLCLENAELVAYSHGHYYELGDVLGFFGYSVASPKALKRRLDEMNRNHKKKSG
ncbi:MAG: flavin reductase family protein [Clostridiaceae bacterium]|nr:flavin reductase family protein [Clostridiaceae bacterium]